MKSNRLIQYLIIILLIIIVALSFVVRVLPLEYTHYWDETVYLNHAETINSGQSNYSEINSRPPFLSILIAGAYFIKHHIFSANILVAILGAIGVFFTYLIGKKMYNKYVGLIAATLLGLSHFIVLHSHFIHTDVPSLTFLTIAIYLFIIKDNKVNQLFSGLFFAIATLTRFTSLIIIIILFVYLLIIYKSKIITIIKNKLYLLCGILLGLLPYFIWVQIKYGFFLHTLIRANAGILHSFEPLYFYLVNIFSIYSFIIILGFIIFIFYLNKRKIKNKELFFILWIIIFFIYISLTPHKEIRYLIPIALPLIILASKGFFDLINNKSSKIKYMFIIIIVILLFIHIAPCLKFNKPIVNYATSNEMDVSNYIINNLDTNNHMIYANCNYPVFAYYTNLKTIKLTNFNEKYFENMNQKGYLIIYKDLDIPPTYFWVDTKEEFVKIKEFENIIIYKYTKFN